MKLSVATYRASAERLTSNMRQARYGAVSMSEARRGSSLDSGSERLLMSGQLLGFEGDQNLEALRAITISDPLRVHALDLSFRRDHHLDSSGPFHPARLESHPCLSSYSQKSLEKRNSPPGTLGVSPLTRPSVAMMVDGSPRRVQVAAAAASAGHPTSTSPHGSDPQVSISRSPREKRGSNGTGGLDSGPEELVVQPSAISGSVIGRLTASDTVGGDGTASASTPGGTTADAGGTGGRSRWLKLRTTVQLSGAITHVNRKHPLKREDSFLTRFSTRQIHDPASSGAAPRSGGMWGDYGSNATGGEGGIQRPWYGIFTTVFNPDENALFMWLWILTGCVLYNAWTLIVRQAFPELQASVPLLWYTTDIFSDIVYILDIVIQFRTGYLEQGMMVCDARKLTGHYARSKMFLMDLLALTPLDLIQFSVGPFPLLRFPRFIKVYRSYRFYYMVESRTIYPNLWRVVNLIHILLLLAHWFGCFYYMLSELEDFQGSWSYPRPEGNWSFMTRKYLGSVYWSTLTLTTIGDLATPATNLQYSFTIVSYLIGVFVFATIVGQVGNVITNRNASRLEFERLLDGAKLYMRHHKVPHNMQRRVQRWYDYSWSRGRMQGGGDINSALGILPDKLKTELALHVNLKTLKKVTIFQECQPEFLHDLVLKMKAYIFTPGDMICRKGEVAREMFIIADGILEVISESGKVLTQMKAGDFFGEIGILNLDGFNRRTADVCSVGYSELFSLSREDVLAAMKDYPEAQEILQTMGRKRLMEARLAAVACKRQDEPSAASTPSGRPGSASGQAKDASSTGGSFKGAKEPGRKLKPTMLKLKKDVQNLQRLLRSKTSSVDSRTDLTAETSLEMAALPDAEEASSSGCGPGRNQLVGKRFHRLLSKIHSRSDSITSQTVKESVVTTAISNETPKPVGEGLPLLERIKLLRQLELAKAAAAPESSSGNDDSAKPSITAATISTTTAKPVSFKLLAGSMAGGKSAKCSVTSSDSVQKSDIPKNGSSLEISKAKEVPGAFKLLAGSMAGKSAKCNVTTSESVQKTETPKNVPNLEISHGMEKSKTNVLVGHDPTCDQSNVPSPRVPLLKKVLMKARDEPSNVPQENVVKVEPSVQVNNLPDKVDEATSSQPASERNVCDTKPFVCQDLTKHTIANRILNENGERKNDKYHLTTTRSALPISPLATVSKPAALIGIKSPLIITPELLKAPTMEGYAARRTRLVRMQAFEIDSLDESDESASSVESQIEASNWRKSASQEKRDATTTLSPVGIVDAGVRATSPIGEIQREGSRSKSPVEEPRIDERQISRTPGRRSSCGDGFPPKRCDSPTEALLESYFNRVMKCMKQVLKTYLDETQRDLHRQITSLQTQLEEKSLLIKELQEALKAQDIETDLDEDDDFPRIPTLSSLNNRSQSIESSGQHVSWPGGLAHIATRKRPTHQWEPFSQDDGSLAHDAQMSAGFSTEDLWRTEFPPEPEIIELPSPTVLASRTPVSNDWEIKMLVEEFDKKLQEQNAASAASRRHSCGDFLTKHRAFRSAPNQGRFSEPSLTSAEHYESPEFEMVSDHSGVRRDEKPLVEPLARKLSIFGRRGPKLASCRRRSLPHFSLSTSGVFPVGSHLSSSSQRLTSADKNAGSDSSGDNPMSPPQVVSSTKKVSFFQRKRFSLSDISSKRRSSLGAASSSVGFLTPNFSSGRDASRSSSLASSPDSPNIPTLLADSYRSQIQRQSTNVPRDKRLPSTRHFSKRNSSEYNEGKLSPSLPIPTTVPENLARRATSSYSVVTCTTNQSLSDVSRDSDGDSGGIAAYHHHREGFSSLHCLPTITEDDAGANQSPSFRRLGHSQSFSEEHAASYRDLVSITSLNLSTYQPIAINSRTPSSDTVSERTADLSDSGEDTPLVSTVGSSIAIAIPEYQPLLSPP